MDLPRPKSSKGRSRSAPNPGSLRSHSRSRSSPRPAAAAPPPAPLNRYKVLPSIESRRPEAEAPEDTGRPGDAGGPGDAGAPEDTGGPGDAGAAAGARRGSAPPDAEPRALLLAVRAPCGRRFEQRFDPAEPLRAVREGAEARFGAAYGEVSIEAVEVPRRSFTDLERSLEECGISNRSLLCISLRRAETH